MVVQPQATGKSYARDGLLVLHRADRCLLIGLGVIDMTTGGMAGCNLSILLRRADCIARRNSLDRIARDDGGGGYLLYEGHVAWDWTTRPTTKTRHNMVVANRAAYLQAILYSVLTSSLGATVGIVG
ncbi:hypothetical protein F5Y08DRAFT_123722 [Xylaria arbuscula]|nr:hypothetical protein F5Y08DRAFT_123722 [Xylaria arbuscula]